MRRETLDRAVLPVAIPVAAIIGIVFFVFFFSRILLAVAAVEDTGPILAALIALGMSLNVLTASALVAALPRLRTPIIVGALVVGAILLGGAGTLAMALSDEASLAGGEAAERGPEQVPPGGEQPTPGGEATPGETPSPGAEETCKPNGTTLSIAAPAGATGTGFDKTCLAVPADKAITVEFVNDDSSVHDWALYRDESAEEHLGGGTTDEPIEPGQTETYGVDPLGPGQYFYRCDFHPTAMTGTFVVK
jgi:plastocyanin